MNLKIIISTITPDAGKDLAYKLIDEKLIGCVNIISNIRSIYYWQGKIEDDEEVILFMKTTDELLNECVEFIKENHPYDVPEIMILKPEDINKPYLDWLNSVVKK